MKRQVKEWIPRKNYEKADFYLTEEPIPFRGTRQARLQAEVQAHGAGYGVEHSVSASDSAGHEPGVHPVLRQKYAALHDVPVRGQPDVLVLPRGDNRRHERADEQCAHLHEDQRAQIHVPADEERFGNHQLRPDAAGVLPVCGH